MSTNQRLLSVAAFITVIAAVLAPKSDVFSPGPPRPPIYSVKRKGQRGLVAVDDEHEKKPNRNEYNPSGLTLLPPRRHYSGTGKRKLALLLIMTFERYCKSAFDRPLAVENCYGDDVLGMLKHLPALFDQCKQLGNTPLGQRFADLRLPTLFSVATSWKAP